MAGQSSDLAQSATAPLRPTHIDPDRSGPPNLLLIGIDTLRQDHLHLAGYARPTTPHLEKLAGQGTTFLDVTAPAPWTLPSFAAAMTGLMPGLHGAFLPGAQRCMDDQPPQCLNPDVVTLAGHLRRQGYATAAFYSNQFFAFGLAESFDQHHYYNLPAGDLATLAQDWIRRHADRPFFCFLLLNDPHEPTTPVAEDLAPFLKPATSENFAADPQHLQHYARWGEPPALELGQAIDAPQDVVQKALAAKIALYDATIHYVDRTLNRIQRQLNTWNLASSTLVSVFSDHGEEFLDHADFSRLWRHDPRPIHGIGHGHTQFQELLHVPWLAWGPGVPAGIRRRDPVSLCDLAPTLLDWMGLDPLPLGPVLNRLRQRAGSLAPALLGRSVANPQRADEVDAAAQDRLLLSEAIAYGPDLVALRQGRWKLIAHRDGKGLALFDLMGNPTETTDVTEANPEVVSRLLEFLKQWRSSGFGAEGDVQAPSGQWQDLDDTVRQRLKDLGYSD